MEKIIYKINISSERVSESSNQQLKIDFEKHRIPERLKKVASLVTNTHYHSFAGTQGDDKEFTLFTCLRYSRIQVTHLYIFI